MNEVKICVLKNSCPVKILVLKSAVNKIAIGSLFNAKMVFYYSIYFLKLILFWKDCPFHPGCQGGCPCQNYKIIFELKFKIFNKIKYIRNIYFFRFHYFFEKCRDRILVINSASGQKASIFEWGEKENLIENIDFTYEVETSES